MKVIFFFYLFFGGGRGMSLLYFIWKIAQRLFLLSSWAHLPSSQNLVLVFPYSLLIPVESHFSFPLLILSSSVFYTVAYFAIIK